MRLGIFGFQVFALALAVPLVGGVAHAQSAPDITVAMNVACRGAAACETNWSKQANGVARNAQCPAFCYEIAITNSGSAALRSLLVNDSVFGDLTSWFNFPTTLLPGDFRTTVFTATFCESVANVVTVTAQKTSSAHTVTNSDGVVAVVRPIVAALAGCEILFSSPDDIDGNPGDGRVTFPPDGDLHFLTNSFKICNAGDTDLTDVRVSDPPLEAFGAECSNAIRAISFDLAMGQCRTVALCTVFVPECFQRQNALAFTARISLGTNHYCGDALDNLATLSECGSASICVGITLSRGIPHILPSGSLANFGSGPPNADALRRHRQRCQMVPGVQGRLLP